MVGRTEFASWRDIQRLLLLQRIWHEASGDYFDIMSQRFDRHEEASKNSRDVSEPETGPLPHGRASSSAWLTRAAECDSDVQATLKTVRGDL